jgi:hypothetical protein
LEKIKMKKLILLLFLTVISFASNADVCQTGRSTAVDNAGALVAGSLEKCYINVRNVSGSSVQDGGVFTLNLASDDGYSVTTSTTAGSVPVCIVAKKDGSTCANDELCRCQTYGLNAGVTFDSTNDGASAGDNVFISESTAGYVESEALGTIAASDTSIGVFYDEATASGDVEVFIKLR